MTTTEIATQQRIKIVQALLKKSSQAPTEALSSAIWRYCVNASFMPGMSGGQVSDTDLAYLRFTGESWPL